MAVNLVRYAKNGATHWGVVSRAFSPLQGAYPTSAALIEGGEPDWRAAGDCAVLIGRSAFAP